MAKFYLVAKHEYLKLVKKRSFIISTLGRPSVVCCHYSRQYYGIGGQAG